MRFADIPYHHDVKERLRRMVDEDRIPHALLLEGPAGASKYALARAMAQYIHCTNRTPDGDSCGKCAACQQHQEFNHIDTIFSFPVVKTGKGLSDEFISEFQDLLRESPFMNFEKWLVKLNNVNAQPLIYVSEALELIRKLSYTTQNSKYKVVLMWLPERLKIDAANKLLKLIEEPFSDTIFILASDNSKEILPTIYSRTQRILVHRYSDAELAEYLRQEYNLADEDAEQIARLAAGNITEAINLISISKERKVYLEMFKELMRKAYTRSIADLRKWAADMHELGRESQMRFYEYCARMVRENFILNLRTPQLNCLNTEEMQFSAKFAPFINERNVLKIVDSIDNARKDIAANGYAKLVNFDLAVKMILLLKR